MGNLLEHNSSDNLISISIIEDNRFIRQGWKAVLQEVEDFLILGSYSSCEEAFEAPDIGDSDVVLMDIGLPGMSGTEGVSYLRQKFSEISVVMCTVHDDDQNVFDAICAGAVGYLLKKTPPEELIRSIRIAASGGSPMTPNIARKVLTSFQKPRNSNLKSEDRLTEREEEVLMQLSEGKSYLGISGELNLSIDGVRYHIRRIYEKLQVHSRSEAIAKGLKNRIIRLPNR